MKCVLLIRKKKKEEEEEKMNNKSLFSNIYKQLQAISGVINN